MKIYFITKKIEGDLPWVVVDVHTSKTIASFSVELDARKDASSRSNNRFLSCCKMSKTSCGWSHNDTCKGVVLFNNAPQRKRTYLTASGYETQFEEVSDNVWRCVRGGWEGEVLNKNELQLHHVRGMVSYESYTEIIYGFIDFNK